MPRWGNIEGSMQVPDMAAPPSSSRTAQFYSAVMRESELKIIANVRTNIQNVVAKNHGIGRLFNYIV